MEKKNNFWMGIACLMTGIVIGFLLAPIKNGVSLGNNSGNNYRSADGEIWDCEDEDDEDAIAF